MKILLKQSIVFSLLIITLFGCSKDSGTTPVVIPDTTKPTISISKPSAGQVFTSGIAVVNIPFEATFADNVNLKSYSVAISKKIVGGMILKIVPTSVPFAYTKSTTSLNSGVKSQVVTLSDINLPANTANQIVTTGVYNLTVTCNDGSDNLASTTIEFTIN